MANPLNTPIPSTPQGVPITTPQTGVYPEAAGELQGGVQPTYWEKFFDTAAQSFYDGPYATTERFRSRQQLETDLSSQSRGKISPDEANRLYPGLEKPFSDPVYPEVAQKIADQQERLNRNKAWLSRGPDLGLVGGFAAGALGMATDPFNLIGGELIGAGSRGLGLARGLKGGLKGIGTVFAENALVVGAGEGVSQLGKSAEQRTTDTLGEFSRNVLGGAAIGTGIHLAIDAAFIRASKDVELSSKSTIDQNAEAALKQHESGSKVDMAPASALQGVREAGGTSPGSASDYVYLRLQHPDQVYYHTPVDTQSQWTGGSESLGGILGVDNAQTAHNLAYSGTAVEGKVIKSELAPGTKLLDANIPLSEALGGEVEQALERVQGILGEGKRAQDYLDVFKKVLDQGGTVGDAFRAFEDIPNNRLLPANEIPTTAFRSVVDGLGYDGISFRGEVAGSPVDNRVLVYNEHALNPVDVVDVNAGSVPTYDSSTQRALSDQAQAVHNERFYDPVSVEETQKLATATDEKLQPQAETIVKQLEQNALKDLQERIKETPALQDELAKIEEDYKSDKMFKQGVKILADCMTGRIG